MNKESNILLKVFLWAICIYHIIAGIIGTLCQQLVPRVATMLYGIKLDPTPQIQILVRYIGVFCITFGILMAFAAIDPVKNKKIIYGGVVYFVIRAFDRIVFWKLIQEYSMGPGPNWFRILMILIMGLGLFIFRPKDASA